MTTQQTKSREQAAKDLATALSDMDSAVTRIVRIVTDSREEWSEPIILLEVNANTTAAGIIPVGFGPSDLCPFPSDVIDVTPEEYEKIRRGELPLPEGWRLADTPLYDRAAG